MDGSDGRRAAHRGGPHLDDARAAAGRRLRRHGRSALVAVVAIVLAQLVVANVEPVGHLAQSVWVLAVLTRLAAGGVLLGACLMGLWSVTTFNGTR